MKGVSVILCCFNSVHRLPTTLDFLTNQITNSSLKWEVILIDNNSTDNTSNYASHYFESLISIMSYRILNENRIGLAYARERGVAEASYDYLIFCDDDNWLCNTYVQEVYNYFEKLPKNVGVIGGIGEAVFEKKSLNGKGIYAGATGTQSDFEGEILEVKGVYGAGMAIKREIFYKINRLSLIFLLSDRVGKKMSCGGDTEICMLSIILGYKIHYYSSLKFYHFMPNYRLTLEHCLEATMGVARSKFYLVLYNIIIKSSRAKTILYFFPFVELYNSILLIFESRLDTGYAKKDLISIGFERVKNVFNNIFFYYSNLNYFLYLNRIKKF